LDFESNEAEVADNIPPANNLGTLSLRRTRAKFSALHTHPPKHGAMFGICARCMRLIVASLTPLSIDAQAARRKALPLDVALSLKERTGRSPVDLSPDVQWVAHIVEMDKTVPRDTIRKRRFDVLAEDLDSAQDESGAVIFSGPRAKSRAATRTTQE
jgi:hypothetical protein